MSRIGIVARREYRETVRKKSFVILTVLMPLLFAGLMFVPSLVITRGTGTKRVLVLDGTARLAGPLAAALAADAGQGTDAPGGRGRKSTLRPTGALEAEVRPAADPRAEAERHRGELLAKRWDAILAIPAASLDGEAAATWLSRTSTDLITRERVGRAVDRALLEARAERLGITAEQVRPLVRRLDLESIQVTSRGTSRGGGDADLLLAILFGLMLLLPSLLHASEILRGVAQEKSDRIVESLVSSMSAYELLTGKILGLAAVGLTQIAAWSAIGIAGGLGLQAPLAAMGLGAAEMLSASRFAWFALFYVLGYLINACVFATCAAIVNSEKEAQQMLQPAMLVLMAPWFVVFAIVTDSDSTLSVGLSLAPLYSPMTMFLRIVVGDPPLWQIGIAVGSAVLSVLALFWLASRVFRVGILWYGKRPSLPEFVRWIRMP